MILRLLLALMLTLSGRVLCAPLEMGCCAPAEAPAKPSCCGHREDPASSPHTPARECSCEISSPAPTPSVDYATPHVLLPFVAAAPFELNPTHFVWRAQPFLFHGPPYPLPRLISLRI